MKTKAKKRRLPEKESAGGKFIPGVPLTSSSSSESKSSGDNISNNLFPPATTYHHQLPFAFHPSPVEMPYYSTVAGSRSPSPTIPAPFLESFLRHKPTVYQENKISDQIRSSYDLKMNPRRFAPGFFHRHNSAGSSAHHPSQQIKLPDLKHCKNFSAPSNYNHKKSPGNFHRSDQIIRSSSDKKMNRGFYHRHNSASSSANHSGQLPVHQEKKLSDQKMNRKNFAPGIFHRHNSAGSSTHDSGQENKLSDLKHGKNFSAPSNYNHKRSPRNFHRLNNSGSRHSSGQYSPKYHHSRSSADDSGHKPHHPATSGHQTRFRSSQNHHYSYRQGNRSPATRRSRSPTQGK